MSEPVSSAMLERLETFDFDARSVSCDFLLLLALVLYPDLFKTILTSNEQFKQNPTHSSFSQFQKKKWAELFENEAIFGSWSAEEVEYSFLSIQDGFDREGLRKVLSIYPERNKLFWKHSTINVWMKRVCGFLAEAIESGNFNIKAFRTALDNPEDIDFADNLAKYSVPFDLKIHRRLLTGNFTDQQDRINFADIDEQDREQLQNLANARVSSVLFANGSPT